MRQEKGPGVIIRASFELCNKGGFLARPRFVRLPTPLTPASSSHPTNPNNSDNPCRILVYDQPHSPRSYSHIQTTYPTLTSSHTHQPLFTTNPDQPRPTLTSSHTYQPLYTTNPTNPTNPVVTLMCPCCRYLWFLCFSGSFLFSYLFHRHHLRPLPLSAAGTPPGQSLLRRASPRKSGPALLGQC